MGRVLIMASTFPIPLTTLPVGSRTFGPATVPDTDTAVTLTIDRTVASGLNALTSASTLTMLAEMSSDGGVTWHAVDITAPGTQTFWGTTGGLIPTKTGNAPASSATWPLAAGTGRRVRATVTVGGPSSIAVTGSIATQ